MTPRPTSILIVEDHPVVRRGMKDILAEECPNADFGEAGDSITALQVFNQRMWDVVLLDIAIPGRGGLDVLEEIRRLQPATPVLVVTAFPEEEYAVRAFKLGARGYLNSKRPRADLIPAPVAA